MPPSHLLRSGALTVDPFLLRGATIGAAWWAEQGGAAGAVFHTAAGAIPIGSGLPVVVTLLDLAPWELPERLPAQPGGGLRPAPARPDPARRGGGDRGHRGHGPGGPQPPADPARAPRRGARWRPAPRSSPVPGVRRPVVGRLRPAGPAPDPRTDRERLGLPERYLVYSGRYDARQDLGSLIGALSRLSAAGRPAELDPTITWPPRVLLIGASPDDRAALARATAREGVGELLAYAPALAVERVAALVAEARAAILPSISEAAGLPAIEALAAGTPVIASAVGALPEIVGGAGILVEPREPERLAAAIATAWTDDDLWARLRADALTRTGPGPLDLGRRGPGNPGRLHRCRRPARPRGRGHRDLRPVAWVGAGRRGRRGWGWRGRRRGVPSWTLIGVPPGHHVHEGLAHGQADLVAGAVVEQGRARDRGLLPGALDRVARSSRSRPGRCPRSSPRGGACRPRRR